MQTRAGRSTQTTPGSESQDLSMGSPGAALTVVIPGDLETRTGGYEYDRRIVAGLRARGWSVELSRLDATFPQPTPAAREGAARALAGIPDGATVLVDGLALGALPDEIAREAGRLAVVALVHHPLAAETGLDPDVAATLEASERRALAFTRVVVVTSRATAAAVARYGVSDDRIAVVEPGTDRAALARGSQSTISNQQSAISLLCVATLTPRKGHELLCRALADVSNTRWRLVCAGSLDRDPATTARVHAQLRAGGLEHRVSLVGELGPEALALEYDRADVFVLATLYEGYGMAVAEALARGLPIVSTATGGIEAMVDGAGLIVPPGNLDALTGALSRVLGDPHTRSALAERARQVRDLLPTWDDATTGIARALERASRRSR
jgi:glycosyltransferase involved in cell wall biosynthesis